MAFHRPHPRQIGRRKTCEEYKAELEEDNYHLQEAIQSEVDINRQNEKRINQLERDYTRCEQEIQDLNKEIEHLENASEEEIVELRSEISSLKKQLYHAKKDVRDKGKLISSLEKQLVESEEQVEKLRNRIKVISRRNSPVRGNSPDLYNLDIDLKMATITELSNAIDGYLNNTTTGREILVDQIKRATRQIRRKENNLQQDLVREQRRRYDAEAERDNEIIRRQNAEGVEQMAIADLYQLQTNAQNQVNRMIDNIARKQTRIGELLRENFAFQLINRRRKAEADLAEFNRAWVFNRYQKWKAREIISRQNIFNLQGQILALQNNPPNQINMALPAGVQMPELHSFEQDHENYVDNFIAYINFGNINDDARIRNILDRSVKGEVREWYHREFDNKNWELQNVLDNSAIGANIGAICGANAVAITGAVTSFPNVPLSLADADIIPA